MTKAATASVEGQQRNHDSDPDNNWSNRGQTVKAPAAVGITLARQAIAVDFEGERISEGSLRSEMLEPQ